MTSSSDLPVGWFAEFPDLDYEKVSAGLVRLIETGFLLPAGGQAREQYQARCQDSVFSWPSTDLQDARRNKEDHDKRVDCSPGWIERRLIVSWPNATGPQPVEVIYGWKRLDESG